MRPYSHTADRRPWHIPLIGVPLDSDWPVHAGRNSEATDPIRTASDMMSSGKFGVVANPGWQAGRSGLRDYAMESRDGKPRRTSIQKWCDSPSTAVLSTRRPNTTPGPIPLNHLSSHPVTRSTRPSVPGACYLRVHRSSPDPPHYAHHPASQFLWFRRRTKQPSTTRPSTSLPLPTTHPPRTPTFFPSALSCVTGTPAAISVNHGS